MPKDPPQVQAAPQLSQQTPGSASAAVASELTLLGPAVRALARHVLGGSADHAELEDCAAEVLRRALEGHERRASSSPLRPWVLGIARHVCLDALRAKRRARGRADDSALLDEISDDGPGAEQQLESAEQHTRLRAALDALPAPQRIAVLMLAEGHGYREIGDRLAVPIGTVCTWISRARRELALTLGEDGGRVSR